MWRILVCLLLSLCQLYAGADEYSSFKRLAELKTSDGEITSEMIDLFAGCGQIGLDVYVQNGQEIGLLEESVKIAARSRLRSARLYKEPPGPVSGILDVSVHILRDGPAFSHRTEFRKIRLDVMTDSYVLSPSGWDSMYFGTHGKNANYVLSSLSKSLDLFIDDFLRINNDGACEPIHREAAVGEEEESKFVSLEEMGLPADYNPFPDESE